MSEQKIISYNVNGIRAASKKGLLEFLQKVDADTVCLQEVKARPQDVDDTLKDPLDYQGYWHSAEKKGYSGVATFTRKTPIHVEVGCGNELYDREGRILRLDFEEYSVMNVYIPSGSSGEERQAFKEEFLEFFHDYVQEVKKKVPNLVICGDFNICHSEIDIHNPKTNKKTSGFLPQEREWVTNFLEGGFVDSFRNLHPEPDNYTWWSYRARSREKNLGWRIDYHMVSEDLFPKVDEHYIHSDAYQSDHCPIELVLKF